MSRAKGNIAEERAREYLEQNGFEIVDYNHYSRFGEIDIIATKDGVLHFVEVKSSLSYEVAVGNITKAKLKKIFKTADVYMKKNNYTNEYCFDAVVITPETLEYVENITI